MNWTEQQVLSFAPNANAAKRGQGLATTRKWNDLSSNGWAIWGLCQSSGKNPYKTIVDLNGPAFKCSCPSRQFPCKHGVALLLLYANGSDGFAVGEPTGTTAEWLQKRAVKSAPKPKIEPTPEEVKKVAAKKTATKNKRLQRMQDGLQDLELWMSDIMRQGLASLEKDAYKTCEDIAKRMQDAQLKGVANRLRELPMMIGYSDNWIERVLAALGEIYLFAQAFKRIDTLPENFQAQLKIEGGINIKKEELADKEGVKDEWLVLGKIEGTDPLNDSLTFRRIWLWGNHTGRPALVLDFAFGGAGFQHHFAKGMSFEGEVIYYPGTLPLRCIVSNRQPSDSMITSFDGNHSLYRLMNKYAIAISKNPWLLDYPCLISGVTPIMENDKLYIVDQDNIQLPVQNKKLLGWTLIALSGGHPIEIFGEWTGEILVPLSACYDGRFIDL